MHAFPDLNDKRQLGGKRPILVTFLDASTHLYLRVCPSVGRAVGPLLFPSLIPGLLSLELASLLGYRRGPMHTLGKAIDVVGASFID